MTRQHRPHDRHSTNPHAPRHGDAVPGKQTLTQQLVPDFTQSEDDSFRPVPPPPAGATQDATILDIQAHGDRTRITIERAAHAHTRASIVGAAGHVIASAEIGQRGDHWTELFTRATIDQIETSDAHVRLEP